jgi:type VI secretion system protein ImpH
MNRRPESFFADPLSVLKNEPYRFDFFQAVRLLCLAFSRDESQPTGTVGEDYEPSEECVRFGAVVSHSFPAGAIQSFAQGTAAEHESPAILPPKLLVSFMGLTGPNGVLPQHYTQLLIDRVRQKDYALRDFLDLFNHRFISFFYRIWRKYRIAPTYEAAKSSDDECDVVTQSLFSLIGLGTSGLRRRLLLYDETFLYYGGLYAQSTPTAVSLERIVQDYFNVPVRINQFRGQWLELERSDQSRLASDDPYGLSNNRLGISSIAGQRVWSVENKFRVRIGPLSHQRFQDLLPIRK